MTEAHPAIADRTSVQLTSKEWDRLVPRLPVGEGWPDRGIERGVPAAWYFACALERRLPDPAPENPATGPRGTIRFEVRAPFEIRPLLATPERIPRLWRRLSTSRLWLCRESATAAAEIHEKVTEPRENEVLIVAEDEPLPTAVDRARVRVADGFLLPAFAEVAKRLERNPAHEAPSEEVSEWLARARGARGAEGHRLFKTGGYRLVPGEWISSAYRPVTRAILLAGAHALERTDQDVVVRVTIGEQPKGGVDGEWVEWMTALELVAGGCPDHPFELWFIAETDAGGSRGVGLEWGPEIRTGWVIDDDRPLEELHPRLLEKAASSDENATATDSAADPSSISSEESDDNVGDRSPSSVPSDGSPAVRTRGGRS